MATKNPITEKMMAGIAKEFGDNSIYYARDMPAIPMVSSGSLALDFAIGAGGIPTNRMVEIAGNEGSGKTTLSFLIANNIIDTYPDRSVVYFDLEHKLTPEWMETLVTPARMDSILIVAPDSIEQTTEIYRRLTKTGNASMVIIDSIGGAPTNQAMDDTRNVAEKAESMGGNAKGVSAFSRMAANLSAKYECLTVGINQTRDDTKSRHGNMLSTPGGHAWRHACVLRIELKRGYEKYEIKRNGEVLPVGFDVKAKIHKNQLGGQEGRTAEYRFFTQETEEFGPFGVDTTEECVRLAELTGVVTRGGAYYRHSSFPDGQIMGKDKVSKTIREKPEVRKALVADVMAALQNDPDKIAAVSPIEPVDED